MLVKTLSNVLICDILLHGQKIGGINNVQRFVKKRINADT